MGLTCGIGREAWRKDSNGGAGAPVSGRYGMMEQDDV